ncbi:MAG TPA: Smr/MutS family protein [Myxococcota bacterium]|nr:Smr/MutS family protein [Myxococcota bacterium]HYK11982.1 Smr/MutS family protein [Gemmatimonadales bacterium]
MPKHPKFDPSDPLLDGPAAATLDLHGFPAGEVEPALKVFLETWKARMPGAVVHVITGRGRGSKGAPILRPLVRRLIKDLPAGMVRDWAPTHDEGGYRIRL